MSPERMAEIHAAAFAGQGQVWSVSDFVAICARPGTRQIAVSEHGFALIQLIAPEAELLTLAVAPPAQRRGLGRRLIDAAMAEAARQGAETLFLEVAEDNALARRLYAQAGFAETGRRRGYYNRAGTVAIDAIMMACPLDAENSGRPFSS